MIIKNVYIRIIWKILIALVSTAGLAISFGLGYGQAFPEMLFYFTILSGMLVAIYFWIDAITIIKNLHKVHSGENDNTNLDYEPALALKHTALFGIILTGIIANTLLVGQLILNDWRDIWVDILLHKMTPLMVFLDFIFCEKHGKFKLSHPFLSIIFPFCYFIFTEITVNLLNIDMSAADSLTMYPYQFLDPAINGISGVIIIIIIIIVAFILTGLIFFAIDKLFAKFCK